MSIDTMTWLTFIFMALALIFSFLRMRKFSIISSIAAIVIYIAANKTFFYLAFFSLKDMFQK